jgi:hypothetical protein
MQVQLSHIHFLQPALVPVCLLLLCLLTAACAGGGYGSYARPGEHLVAGSWEQDGTCVGTVDGKSASGGKARLEHTSVFADARSATVYIGCETAGPGGAQLTFAIAIPHYDGSVPPGSYAIQLTRTSPARGQSPTMPPSHADSIVVTGYARVPYLTQSGERLEAITGVLTVLSPLGKKDSPREWSGAMQFRFTGVITGKYNY